MKIRKIIITLTLVFALLPMGKSFACTTAVISGKYTADGRPMIWKLRDTDDLENRLQYFTDGKYTYIGLVNAKDILGQQVWAGVNATGFAIMNSASFNVNLDYKGNKANMEGEFMKRALQTCATLKDFEEMLRKEPRPMGLAAHFGVIDAQGGAAFYEVNNETFTKFDANDAAQAPNGYIIRTNFSFTGKKDVGYGFIRYQIAQDNFYNADAMGNISYKGILQDFTRTFKHPVLKKNFREEYSAIPYGENFITAEDLTTRSGTSSNIVIQGVKKGENPELATMWTHIGFPNTCLALPAWVKGGDNLPSVLVKGKNNNAPLNDMALQLKKECYPIGRSDGGKFLLISKLFNREGTGFIQKLEPVEKEIFAKTEEKLKQWREKTPSVAEIKEYYNWLDNLTLKTYDKEFNVKPYQPKAGANYSVINND